MKVRIRDYELIKRNRHPNHEIFFTEEMAKYSGMILDVNITRGEFYYDGWCFDIYHYDTIDELRDQKLTILLDES